jgi:YHS domain-containing protein
MKSAIYAAVAALALGGAVLVAADTKDAKKSDDKPTTQPSAQPVNKYCAIERDHKIDPKGKTYLYKGKTIGFCCEDCIDEFKKDPEKYMAKLK